MINYSKEYPIVAEDVTAHYSKCEFPTGIKIHSVRVSQN